MASRIGAAIVMPISAIRSGSMAISIGSAIMEVTAARKGSSAVRVIAPASCDAAAVLHRFEQRPRRIRARGVGEESSVHARPVN